MTVNERIELLMDIKQKYSNKRQSCGVEGVDMFDVVRILLETLLDLNEEQPIPPVEVPTINLQGMTNIYIGRDRKKLVEEYRYVVYGTQQMTSGALRREVLKSFDKPEDAERFKQKMMRAIDAGKMFIERKYDE